MLKIIQNSSSFFKALFIIFSISLPVYAAENNKHHQSKSDFNFGPGESYLHSMKIKPSDFKKVNDISKHASDLPNPINRKQSKTVVIKLDATEVISNIAPGISYNYWTFNNTVPGPFLRVRQGDRVELSLHNDKTSSHKPLY